MNKVFVQLSGGLGNQLFQYATGRALSLRHGMQLALDPRSGFVRDKQYGRKYALSPLLISPQYPNSWDRLPLYFYRLISKLGFSERLINKHYCSSEIHIERKLCFQADLINRKLRKNIWLIGYWQTPKYFSTYAAILRRELMPEAPKTALVRAIGQQVGASEAVAVGIRLYEESSQPEVHARDGVMKTAVDLNKAIHRLRAVRPFARFFVFCTHRPVQLEQLDLPSDTVFVIANEGFSDPVECLWLLAQCKHHIFMNSTYYWWGAWLSEAIHKKEEQLVFAADNFINADGLCDYWQTF